MTALAQKPLEKKLLRKIEFFNFAVWTNEKPKERQTKRKKHSQTSLDLVLKEFWWNKQKLDIKWTTNELCKNPMINWENKKKQSETAACEQKTRKREFV